MTVELPAVSDGAHAMLRELDRRKWTQNELARRIGTDSGVVSRWARGERSPQLKWAVEIEKILGVPVRLWTSFKRAAAAA